MNHCLAVLLSSLCFCAWNIFLPLDLNAQDTEQPKKYWVFFRDKGFVLSNGALSEELRQQASSVLTPRALQRRAKSLPTDCLVDAVDLPLYSTYLHEVEQFGGIFHRESRWLNAASFFLTEQQRDSVCMFSFVGHLSPVGVFSRKDSAVESYSFLSTSTSVFDYGPSYEQAVMVAATSAHALGITGQDVLVGMLDTGFRWRSHEALQGMQVIGEHDFIQNDEVTENQPGDSPNQDAHGTYTLSLLGGYKPGQLIGPAFGAKFLLAKTEYVPSETRIEEDNYVAALEWMERQGVDVTSSSLGYNIFDDGSGYRWENGDFNGRTAVTSRAAAIAARLGVVVCTAMGNEGNGNGVRGTMLTPADADSIISVGAVSFSRSIASFSSTGPTNDGRIKPEVVAPGVQVYGASTTSGSAYMRSNGTSSATPLAAACAALLLSARPELTVKQVRDALLFTADTIATGDLRILQFPNNFSGRGLVNVAEALSYPTVDFVAPASRIAAFVGSAHGLFPDSVFLYYSLDSSSMQTIRMTRTVGVPNRSNGTYMANVENLPLGSIIRFRIVTTDSQGSFIRIPQDSTQHYSFIAGTGTILPPHYTLPTTFVLFQNYPNPFNSSTTISYELPAIQYGSLTIYNVLGQKIKTLYSGVFLPGINTFTWDSTNDYGITAASGFYFYVLRTSSIVATKKMILLR